LLDAIDEANWYTTGVLAGATARHPKAAFGAEQRRFHTAVREFVPGARWFGFDIGATDEEYIRLANAANTFEELAPVMALRERLMYEHVERVLDENPGEKIALMAGSLHLMKNDDRVEAPGVTGPGGDTDYSIGHYVTNVLARGPVLSIWLLHGRGRSANPWLPSPGELTPGDETFDAELLERWDRPCLLVVGDDRAERRITQMHNAVMRCRLGDQVDAIVFAPEVTPLRTP
jgi:hypothetical protein